MAFLFLFLTLVLVYVFVRGSFTIDTRFDNAVVLIFLGLVVFAFILGVL